MSAIGLYIHVPFCSGKCDYCDFYSVELREHLVASYLSAIQHEAELTRNHFWGDCPPKINTVYIGGGTPTSLSCESLTTLCEILHKNFDLSNVIEFSAEANPESISAKKINILQSFGLNRLSLGVQTLNEKLLTAIGRRHTREQTLEAIKIIRGSGITNVSLDLMFGLPGQTLDDLESDIEMMTSFNPKHISAYELTFEPDTPLYQKKKRGKIQVDEEQVLQMMKTVQLRLPEKGFIHYEISNYSMPGFECQHNLNYWNNGEYVGLGPSAAGFIHRERYKNVSSVETYAGEILEKNTLPWSDSETLSDVRFTGECAMLRLRMTKGILRNEFLLQTGFDPFSLFDGQIKKYSELGYLEVSADRLALTPEGRFLFNEIVPDFLGE